MTSLGQWFLNARRIAACLPRRGIRYVGAVSDGWTVLDIGPVTL